MNVQQNLAIVILYLTHLHLSLLHRPSRGAEYCDQPVCLCVCLSVRKHIAGTFVCRSPVTVTWSSSGGVALTLCTSGFMSYVTFDLNGAYGIAWPSWAALATSPQLRARPGRSLISMNACYWCNWLFTVSAYCNW